MSARRPFDLPDKPAQLPEELGMFVDLLRAEHPSIDQVWLLGRHASAADSKVAVWSLIAFADEKVLRAVREDDRWRRDDLRLAVVVDGDRFEVAWERNDGGTLRDWDWRIEDPQCATYLAPGATARASAVRVR